MPRTPLLLMLASLLAAGGADARTERRAASDFHRIARVEGSAKPGEACAIPLSREAVAALKKGGELRLFDAAGREIPSLVYTAQEHSEVIERPVSIFNRSWQEDGAQGLSVELTERKPQAVNEFVFEIEEEDYNLRARVEGSSDGEQWRILGDELHLIRHTEKEQRIHYVHDVLRIPTARFRYYRFTLRPTFGPEPGQAGRPLEIPGIGVRQVVRRGSSLGVPVRLEPFEDPRDADARHDYWKLHLERENLGVDRVEITIPAEDFARPASLWEWSEERGRRTRQLASTVFFHYGKDLHTEFDGFVSDGAVLVLMIDQRDDEPVVATRARASRPLQQVRFLAPAGLELPLALHLEPDEAREPRYDLERRLREHEIRSFTELAHEPLQENPGYATPAQPRSERIPFLLYALVIPLVLGLAWYIVHTIRKGMPEEPPAAEP